MKVATKIMRATESFGAGAALGAGFGASAVGAVCAVSFSVFGPAGTFFGYSVGTGAGAAVGGFIGGVGGMVAEFASSSE